MTASGQPPFLLSLSVVSHGQAHLIRALLADLAQLSCKDDLEVLITVNLPEDESSYQGHPFRVRLIRNETPKGFGANHNAAFSHCRGRYFVILNPDIRIRSLNADTLLAPLADPRTGAVAPAIFSVAGQIEDSARHFPTVWRLARRVLLRQREPDYRWDQTPIEVDWTAGMFVVFRPEAFKAIGGFDDRRFFMYFEDVDICARLWRRGWSVILQPQVSVIHDAQRASHRSLKHLRWHLHSAARYLTGL